jgi:hypothetical protein
MNTPKRGNEQPPVAGRPSDAAREPINPAFWISAIRTNAHVTDCTEKQHVLSTAADKLEKYVAQMRADCAALIQHRTDAANPAQGAEFVMVPREPTDAMLDDGCSALAWGGAGQCYEAMLAAAPPQASSGDAKRLDWFIAHPWVVVTREAEGWKAADIQTVWSFGHATARDAIDAAMHPVCGSGGGE